MLHSEAHFVGSPMEGMLDCSHYSKKCFALFEFGRRVLTDSTMVRRSSGRETLVREIASVGARLYRSGSNPAILRTSISFPLYPGSRLGRPNPSGLLPLPCAPRALSPALRPAFKVRRGARSLYASVRSNVPLKGAITPRDFDPYRVDSKAEPANRLHQSKNPTKGGGSYAALKGTSRR